jgi:SAM-dependent methyltransferase
MESRELGGGAAARAFDAVAESFDDRFGGWRSVSAQRRAVRASLARAFARGARVLELGGGTGEDARWLAERGREVLVTDASPAMVRAATAKLAGFGMPVPRVIDAASLDSLALEREAEGLPPFDGAFSNFAGLNCLDDLHPLGPGLARLVRPGGRLILVLFGTCPPGEVVVQLARRDLSAAFRRRARGAVTARLGGQSFTIRYHRPGEVAAAMSPWFRLVSRRGIGVFVPPSAAEPWISRHPRLLRTMEALDRAASRPLALLGDHVLYELERTTLPACRSEASA